VKVQITPAANAALGRFAVSLSGKAKHQNREYVVTAAPATLSVSLPFELKLELAPVKVAAGDKATIKVTAVRKGAYLGPIALEARNLPANVTAGKVTIAAGQDAAEIEISAAANAALGDKTDVNILGTASEAANQQNPTPNFTLSVIKK